jgi:hypothetical protein
MNVGYRITRVVTPADSLALVTLEQAKDILNIDPADTSQDAELKEQIDATSQAINNYCDRIFVVQTYRDQVRGACGRWGEPLVTRQYPIAVDSAGVPLLLTVTDDGAALDPTLLEVYPETGSLYRLDAASSAPSAWASPLLVVDYTAGFDTIPSDVQSAALQLLAARWFAMGRDPTLRTESIPDVITHVYYSDTTSPGMPSGVREFLAPYRIMTV